MSSRSEHVADVPIGAAALVAALAELLGIVLFDAGLALLGPLALHVADAQHLHVVAAEVAAGQVGPGAAEEVAAALPAQPDEPHADAVAGRRGAVLAQGRGRDQAGSGNSGPDRGKAAARKLSS